MWSWLNSITCQLKDRDFHKQPIPSLLPLPTHTSVYPSTWVVAGVAGGGRGVKCPHRHNLAHLWSNSYSFVLVTSKYFTKQFFSNKRTNVKRIVVLKSISKLHITKCLILWSYSVTLTDSLTYTNALALPGLISRKSMNSWNF